MSAIVPFACAMLAAAGGLCHSACAGVPPHAPVELLVNCPPTLIRTATNVLIITVCITNATTEVAAGAGVTPSPSLTDYEVSLTGAAGQLTNAFVIPKPNGPGAFSGIGNWRLDPGQSLQSAVKVPLADWVKPGRYKLVLKSWCSIYLQRDPSGKPTALARRRLVSNSVEFEIR